LAFDGDADRLMIVDETGGIIDGDYIIAAIATDWKERNIARSNVIVGTDMSNLGLELYLKSLGFTFERTKVGDKFVIERMQKVGSNLGGEQSGHIILLDFSTTGDGLISALQILSYLVRSGKNSSHIKSLYSRVPQVIRNVSGMVNLYDQKIVDRLEYIKRTILNDGGRVVVRRSGTEDVVRIMLESMNENALNAAIMEVEKEIC
jgi:phosphoglucosamine mutase